MNLVPSVTTILKIMAKPGLEQWKLEQMLLSALTLPRSPGEPERASIARIVADSKETAKQAAEAGTRLHESIEKWFAGDKSVEHKETALAFESAIASHFSTPVKHPWIVERSFATEGLFGGKVDMYATPDQYARDGIVIDTKSKDFGPGDKVDAYDEHLIQLAAYRAGLDLPKARCANVFVSRSHPGLVRIVEWTQDDLKRGWEMFAHLLALWKLKNDFKPWSLKI